MRYVLRSPFGYAQGRLFAALRMTREAGTYQHCVTVNALRGGRDPPRGAWVPGLKPQDPIHDSSPSPTAKTS